MWGGNVLLVYDVSDPFLPSLVASVPLAQGFADVAIEGDLLALAFSGCTGGYFLYVYDISDPRHPIQREALPLVECDRLQLLHGRAFVTFGLNSERGQGFTRIDLSDPARPEILGTFGADNAIDLSVGDARIVVADELAGSVQVVGPPDAMPAASLSRLVFEDAYVTSVSMLGTLAFCGSAWRPTHIVDTADPGYPVVVGQWGFPSVSLAFEGAENGGQRSGYAQDRPDPVSRPPRSR